MSTRTGINPNKVSIARARVLRTSLSWTAPQPIDRSIAAPVNVSQRLSRSVVRMVASFIASQKSHATRASSVTTSAATNPVLDCEVLGDGCGAASFGIRACEGDGDSVDDGCGPGAG